MKMELPQGFEEEHKTILNRFEMLERKWNLKERLEDDLMPEEQEYAKQILNFLIKLTEYILNNYKNIDKKYYKEFIGNYGFNFIYTLGNGADHNYLNFDETTAEDEQLEWIMKDLKSFSKKEIEKLNRQLKEILSKFK